jgi:two-component system NtrC family sensor kinase
MLPVVQPPVLLEGTDAFLDATEQGLNHAQILERLDDEIVRATSRGMKLRSRSVSIRTALLWGVLAMAVLPSVLVGGIGVYSIGSSVRREAQSNIDRDLATVFTSYQRELARLAAALQAAGRRVEPAMADPTPVLAAIRRDLGLNVVNLSDPSGRPLDGRGADPSLRVPVDRDPVLRRALEGRVAHGTVALDAERLLLEGGSALQAALAIPAVASGGKPESRSALFWWVASPILDTRGEVAAVLYGGRALNFNDELVDTLRDEVFGPSGDSGPPRGTVTIFLGDVRVATNVRTREGERVIGTRVSERVRAAVFEAGRAYSGEALVVDHWYLSAYTPLRDPTGKTIGMLYVGSLRAPYDELRNSLIGRFLLPVAVVALLAIAGALYGASRITRPVRALGDAATRLARGDWEHRIGRGAAFRELEDLAAAYDDMHLAIQRRDVELRERNDELRLANDKLEQSNRNYMQTLGFVTHELKSPLAAIQMLIGTVLDGYQGPVPDKLAGTLDRVRRNCEELQDMVRDYLDLSRLERGEVVARPVVSDLTRSVVEPALEHTAVFFRSRSMNVRLEVPGELSVLADPELLRVALDNLLTNAAKYGREGGETTLTLRRDAGEIEMCVRNEGEGFPPEEAERLFEKFFRLRNANTQRRRGSGVGLFTVRNIAELHRGRAWAESVPGAWAAFHLRFPAAPGATSSPDVSPAG